MQKKYLVKISKVAEHDIADIWNYIAESNPINATNFILKIEEKIYSLETLPLRHEIIPEDTILNGKRRHLIFKDYRIIYIIEDKTVFVLRVLSGFQILLDL